MKGSDMTGRCTYPVDLDYGYCSRLTDNGTNRCASHTAPAPVADRRTAELTSLASWLETTTDDQVAYLVSEVTGADAAMFASDAVAIVLSESARRGIEVGR